METLTYLRAEAIKLAPSTKNILTSTPFSFTLTSQKLVALVGPNGSGKTTFLKALLGEPVLKSGALYLMDHSSPVKDFSAKEISNIFAFVPQEHLFPFSHKLDDFLRLSFLGGAGLFGKIPAENSPEILEVLQNFRLTQFAKRSLGSLSSGERQRAFLARALLQRPALLLLDEPTNHLDPGGVKQFWQVLVSEIRSRQLRVLLSTHDLSFVKAHCDWVIALKEGDLAFFGSKDDFFGGTLSESLFDY
jgi:iron complex transport system ATP-binding protein